MILLAHAYYLRNDPKQLTRMKPYPPLSTLLAAAMVRERGHDVAVFDAMLAPGVEAFEGLLDDIRPTIVGILEDNFNYLTKMCTLRTREAAVRMIDAARQRGCRVVVNGSDASDHPEIYLGAGAHVVIPGEGEATFAELVDSWVDHPSARLAGVAGNIPGEGVRPPPRHGVGDLDRLPLPAWDLIDADAYRDVWLRAHGRFSWNMATSRGCPYGCNWCAKPIFGRRYAQRSPRNVAFEMRRLKDDVAPDHIWFADDIFGLTADWVEEFSAEVERHQARTPFMIQSRVNLMSPPTVAALSAAGAEEVWLGVESGSQKILDAMEKGTRVEEARAATRALKEHGIRACWFIQLGYPSEEWSDLLRTRDLIRDEMPDDIGVSVAYPLPGTKFHERVSAQLGEKRNWEDTDDLAMMFNGTYTTDFYREVRDLLHAEVRNRSWDDGRWGVLKREERIHRSPSPMMLAR